jgi:hypothetical protein
MLNCDYIESNYLHKFSTSLTDIGYEKKGIWFSEILFIFAFCEYFQSKLLLESGRARGQSTLCLSKLLPKTEILSIEHIKDSEDSLIAEERLKKQDNVKLVYGDSFESLKKIKFNTNFFMLIDGPKNKLAINLAKKILINEKCLGVFMHDCNKGGIERSFENEHKGISYFSDDEQFCERFKYLDINCYNEKRKPYMFSGLAQKSYGPTVGLFLKIGLENKNLLGNLIL